MNTLEQAAFELRSLDRRRVDIQGEVEEALEACNIELVASLTMDAVRLEMRIADAEKRVLDAARRIP